MSSATKFERKVGDLGPTLTMTLDSNGVPADLTGATAAGAIMLRILLDGTSVLKVNAAMTIVGDPTLGNVRYDWIAGDTDTASGFLWVVRATFAGSPNRPVSFPNSIPGYRGAFVAQPG